MEMFGRLVYNGDCVLAVGGHIGYTAVYFSYLVSRTGCVYVFEPSPENLAYLTANVHVCPRNNIIVVDKAVSDDNTLATVYYESVTGQNSTVVPEVDAFARYCKRNNVKDQYSRCTVETITIDRFVNEHALSTVHQNRHRGSGTSRFAGYE
jgi:FkbM family methyltransferase